MKLALVAVTWLFLLTLGSAQKPPDVVGTWVADLKSNPGMRDIESIKVTFLKSGKMYYTGYRTRGEGVYKVVDRKVTLVVSLRNGVVPQKPSEKQATGEISKDGEFLLLGTGSRRGGIEVMLKLIRKR